MTAPAPRAAYLRRLATASVADAELLSLAQAAQQPPATPAQMQALHQAQRGADAAAADRTFLRLAHLHHQAGDLPLCEAALRAALRLRPDDPELQTNLGLVLTGLHRYDEAEALQRRAVAAAPGLAPAWVNLALVLRQRGDHAAADAAARRAAELAPGDAAVLIGQGLQARSIGQHGVAAQAFRQALEVDRQRPEAWINLAQTLLDRGHASAARWAYAQVPQGSPADARALSNRLMALQYEDGLDADTLREAARDEGRRLADTAARHEAAALAAEALPVTPSVGPLRVGYVGGDFYRHPVGWLLLPVLRGHDPARVQVHLFDTAAARPADDVAMALRSQAHAVHSLHGLDTHAACAAVRAAGIDVLVDLSGYTDHARLDVFARRAAPVQLAWLGYFASTGLPQIDGVVLGAAWAAGAQPWYVEPVLALPRLHLAYEPPADAPPVAPCPSASRGAVVFGSFNNSAKLSDTTVALWAGVLRRRPASRLLLKWREYGDPGFAAATRARFAAHGIAPDRIELRGASPHRDMLGEYADLDVALDPYPFPGGLTTLESLWMGVPVVTLAGPRPLTRQSAALLHAVGLDDLVTDTPARFAEVACALADDLPRRQALRADLRRRMSHGPLGDGPGLARALEDLYQAQVERARSGLSGSSAAPSTSPQPAHPVPT